MPNFRSFKTKVQGVGTLLLLLSLPPFTQSTERLKTKATKEGFDTEESRRFYAISIPSAFNNGPPGHYNSPVYHRPPQESIGFNVHSTSAKPPLRPLPVNNRPWNGGLRVIVSAPVEDQPTQLKPINNYKFPNYNSKSQSKPGYYNPYEQSAPTRDVHPHQREQKKDSRDYWSSDGSEYSYHYPKTDTNPAYHHTDHRAGDNDYEFDSSYQRDGVFNYQNEKPISDQTYDYWNDDGMRRVEVYNDRRNHDEKPSWNTRPVASRIKDHSSQSIGYQHSATIQLNENEDHSKYKRPAATLLTNQKDERRDHKRQPELVQVTHQVENYRNPRNSSDHKEGISEQSNRNIGATLVESKTRSDVPMFYRKNEGVPNDKETHEDYYDASYDDELLSYHYSDYYDEDVGDHDAQSSTLDDGSLAGSSTTMSTTDDTTEGKITILSSTEKTKLTSTTLRTPVSEFSTAIEIDNKQTSPPVSPSSTIKPVFPASPHPYRKPKTSTISLSEILQGIGIGLPQFLIQLKLHDTDLKSFTEKLQRKALTKSEFKKAQGNVGEILKILDDHSPGSLSQKPTLPITESTTYSIPDIKLDEATTETPPQVQTTTAAATSPPSTSFKTTETTTEITSTTPTITSTTKKLPGKPKTFGFKPAVIVTNLGLGETKSKISTTKSLDQASQPNEDVQDNNSEEKDIATIDHETSTINRTPKPYKPPRQNWRDRIQFNRNIVPSRTGLTTIRPKARPNYGYYGGETKSGSSKKEEANESDENDLKKLDDQDTKRNVNQRISSIIGLTGDTSFGKNYQHPRYDKDPNSLNIATRSAIMAASVLGGIAFVVFFTILVFVMYKNNSGRKRLIRGPLPLSLSSDSCSSSTPSLYSSRRPRYAPTPSRNTKQSDFWGTLRRKFDPYSLSNASTSATYY